MNSENCSFLSFSQDLSEPYEEQLLLERLGDEYKQYMKNVPMLIPKIRK